MALIKKTLKKQIPGVYIKSLMLGDTVFEDIEHSFFEDVNEQVGEVCQMIAEDPQLRNG